MERQGTPITVKKSGNQEHEGQDMVEKNCDAGESATWLPVRSVVQEEASCADHVQLFYDLVVTNFRRRYTENRLVPDVADDTH